MVTDAGNFLARGRPFGQLVRAAPAAHLLASLRAIHGLLRYREADRLRAGG